MWNLSLRGTKITDEGLNQLKRMKRLEQFDLRDTKVTGDRVKSFQKSMPKLDAWLLYDELYDKKCASRFQVGKACRGARRQWLLFKLKTSCLGGRFHYTLQRLTSA